VFIQAAQRANMGLLDFVDQIRPDDRPEASKT
jgi:hypothetical protein